MSEEIEDKLRAVEDRQLDQEHRISTMEKRQETADKRKNQILAGSIMLIIGTGFAWLVDIVKGSVK